MLRLIFILEKTPTRYTNHDFQFWFCTFVKSIFLSLFIFIVPDKTLKGINNFTDKHFV